MKISSGLQILQIVKRYYIKNETALNRDTSSAILRKSGRSQARQQV